MKQTSLLAFLLMLALQASAQKVIFPQEQQAGAAFSAVVGDTYTLGNDLLSASFTHAGGRLTFNGCEAMGMLPGDDLFSIRLASGKRSGILGNDTEQCGDGGTSCRRLCLERFAQTPRQEHQGDLHLQRPYADVAGNPS